jgi:DNA/RNA endonuclease YhcR with UshA esterase domain
LEGKSLAVGILLGVIIGGLFAIDATRSNLIPGGIQYVTVTSTVTSATTSTIVQPAVTVTASVATTQTPQKWVTPTQEVISYLDAAKYAGQTKTVEGKIVRTFRSSTNTVFLDFHDPFQGYFEAVIFSSDLSKFTFAPEVFYSGKEVRVTGQIQMYEGSPEIIVRNPSQIEVAYMGFNYP